jgi:YegS/Rv2252/BmrU family lipid kinase
VAVLKRRRVLLIINPASRRGLKVRGRALRAFENAGAQCDAVQTDQPGHGARIATDRGRDYEAVFTLGGDGTVMEVVGALANGNIPVGVLAGGTGNLLARTLGIPLNVSKAVPLLLSADAAKVDLGIIANRYFAFAAGVGIDAKMVEETPASLKRRLGVAAYFLTATRAALHREDFLMKAVVDGQAHERIAVAVLLANFGAIFHNLFTLGPGIRQDDGMLDLCVFSPKSLRDSLRIVWRLWRRDFRSDPAMLYARGHRFRIETIPPRAVQADGDLISMTPFEAEVVPLAAFLLVPDFGTGHRARLSTSRAGE